MPKAPLPLHRNLAVAVLVVLPLTVLGCGSSDSATDPAGGTEEPDGDATTTTRSGDDVDTAAFCDEVAVFDELDTEDSGNIGPDVVERFDELVADAPEEVADELATLADAFRTMSETDLDDEEAFAEVMGLFLDPDVIDASEVVEAYVVEECGIDIDPDDSDDAELDDMVSDNTDGSGDDGADGDLVSIDAFEAFLDEAGADAHPWRDDLVGTSISAMNDSIDVALDFPAGVTEEDAVDACTAAAEYFDPLGDDLTITVTVDGSDAASYDPRTGCGAA